MRSGQERVGLEVAVRGLSNLFVYFYDICVRFFFFSCRREESETQHNTQREREEREREARVGGGGRSDTIYLC